MKKGRGKDYKEEASQLRAQVNDLKRRLDSKQKEYEAVLQDRAKFRSYFTDKFKWFIELNSNNRYPTMSWLVEEAVGTSAILPGDVVEILVDRWDPDRYPQIAIGAQPEVASLDGQFVEIRTKNEIGETVAVLFQCDEVRLVMSKGNATPVKMKRGSSSPQPAQPDSVEYTNQLLTKVLDELQRLNNNLSKSRKLVITEE